MSRLRKVLVIANVALAIVAIALSQGLMEFRVSGAPLEAVQAIAARHVHGEDDNGKDLSRIASQRTVVATCGYVSAWAVELLQSAGIRARIVETLTLDAWNDASNAHVMVEVWNDGWEVIDIDRGVRYTDGTRGLSLPELLERVPTDNYRIVPLNEGVDEVAIYASNRRLLQVPLVHHEGVAWFADGQATERVRSYSPKFRPTTDWSSRFYSRDEA